LFLPIQAQGGKGPELVFKKENIFLFGSGESKTFGMAGYEFILFSPSRVFKGTGMSVQQRRPNDNAKTFL